MRKRRNVLWDKYYAPTAAAAPDLAASEFREVFADVVRSDGFYRFLQNIFHLHPEDRFHWLIKETCARLSSDEQIYREVQAALPGIKPLLAPLTHALPALAKQKRDMAGQTMQLLGGRKSFDGYVEIGSIGRYISALRKQISVTGPMVITNDIAPGNGPGDIMERGQFAHLGQFLMLDYQPLDSKGIAPASIDLVTCFIGLHHAPLDLLDGFADSIRRVLRPGGLFIMRDHDVRSKEMHAFVSLVHTVFNLGLGVTWPVNQGEFKRFRSADGWSEYLAGRGFRDLGPRLLQLNDPTDNMLMAFVKTDAPGVT